MEELEDAFVSEDVEDISWYWVDDRQPMYLILQQGVDGIKQTEEHIMDYFVYIVLKPKCLGQYTNIPQMWDIHCNTHFNFM